VDDLPSNPISAPPAGTCPTRIARPSVFQPPRLPNSPQTSWDEAMGARHQSGIMMAKTPMTSKNKMQPSKNGRALAANVTNSVAETAIRMVRSVPCLSKHQIVDAAIYARDGGPTMRWGYRKGGRSAQGSR